MSLTLALQDDRYRAVPAFAWLDWGVASHVNSASPSRTAVARMSAR